MQRLTKRFIVKNIDSLNLSNPIIYERFYLPDQTVIQRKQDAYTKGTLTSVYKVLLDTKKIKTISKQ